jgi:hypothetical protein
MVAAPFAPMADGLGGAAGLTAGVEVSAGVGDGDGELDVLLGDAAGLLGTVVGVGGAEAPDLAGGHVGDAEGRELYPGIADGL